MSTKKKAVPKKESAKKAAQKKESTTEPRKVLVVRCTDAELTTIKEYAKSKGLSVSAFMRSTALAACKG